MAAVVGSRLLFFVNRELRLDIADQVLYSDSKCVLAWIAEQPVGPVFVRNRLNQIAKNIPTAQFRYVPSTQNPADLLSRGCSLSDLNESQLWWRGPALLVDSSCKVEWPTNSHNGECDRCTETGVALAVASVPANRASTLIDVDRFSSFAKLLNTTAYIKRAPKIARGQRFSGQPNPAEIESARQYWLREMQSPFLTASGELKPDREFLRLSRSLSLFVGSDGLIRSRGRFANAELDDQARCPIFLPKQHPVVELIIQDIHCKLLHAGVQHVLSVLRSRYWIPNGRSVVKSAIHRCNLCRKYAGGPFKVPDPPPWPTFRVSMQRPFSCVGLDYLGPLVIRNPDSSSAKSWICLITCTATRAIHLEVVCSLSTEEFLLAFRRFVAVRGVPKLVISDNATQFHAADQIFKALWKSCLESDELVSYASKHGIAWRFITEAAPWMGGFYERLVSPVKAALKRTLDKRRVSANELSTVCYEVAAVLNTRPLAYVSSDPEGTVITPSHLLMRHADQFPNVSAGDDLQLDSATTTAVVARWKTCQKMLQSFWQLWRDQYLTALRERADQRGQRNSVNVNPTVGQIVQVKDSLPRGMWRVARISKLFVGTDGKCRSAQLVLPNGKTLNRPLRLLYPLEASVCDDNFPIRQNRASPVDVRDASKRKAALDARLKIVDQLAEDDASGSE